MEHNKLLHPSVDVLRVDGKDTASLEFAMLILHDIGWMLQQCDVDSAISRVKEYYDAAPRELVKACAHGAAALHAVLGRSIKKKRRK